MGEYMHIDHIDQIITMNTARQMKLREAVKKYLTQYPLKHIKTEWGCLADVDPADAESFIDALLKRMTLEQKVNQMSADYLPAIGQYVYDRYNAEPYYAGEDCSLDIPAIKFTDGPSGVVLGYRSTAFPVSMARAATFDPELERRVGDVIGVEARSLGANFFAGVCINLLRHPGWGRAQETYGEDPCLLGAMGSSLVKGVQEHVMACVKHFAANSIENARFMVSVEMDERILREVYLPHFKDCIDAGAAAVMSAYNQVRGQWCGHNKYLLTDLLKDEWGFDGLVMSDFAFGIRGTEEPALAGLDVEMHMTQFYGERLVKAVREGNVPEAQVDQSVRRIIRQKIRFAHVGDTSRYDGKQVACKEHIELSLEVARKSIVLLKNDSLLPLDRKKVKKILVAGDLAKTGCLGDSKGSSAVFPSYVVSALEGITKASKEDMSVEFARGIVSDEVRKRGKNCDAVVVFVGLTHLDEGEYFPSSSDNSVGGDRVYLGLNPKDIEMIYAAAEGNPNTIVVLQGGSAIQVEPWCHVVKAILMQWYAGMEGGTALGEILYGDVNPSGKLPVTIHAKPQQLPYFGLDLQSVDYGLYHGYFAVDKYQQKVSYPFGFGLSYTKFFYGNPVLAKKELAKTDTLVITIEVENTGKMAGDTVVQLYVGVVDSKVERHKKDLRAFKRVHLEVGEKQQVSLSIPARSLAYYSEQDSAWVVELCQYRVYAGSSSADDDLSTVDFKII